jgi:hypothetical protein
MKVLISPQDKGALIQAYRRACREATELYIATAFLTEWVPAIGLNGKCAKLLILVGTDFGLTRKVACQQVLSWMPSRFVGNFLAVPSHSDGAFHPKIVLWKSRKGAHHLVVGSSNLTSAGFSRNVEANVDLPISAREYQRLVGWLESLALESQVITQEWIEQYRESKRASAKRGRITRRVINIRIPSGSRVQWRILERRKSEKSFAEIERPLRKAIQNCADGVITNSDFWDEFWHLWSAHRSRVQGNGIQFTGKSANWRQACQSMLNILRKGKKCTEIELDEVVRGELDRLQSFSSPVRGAWFTEMLLHFFPQRYPLVNGPVKRWLAKNKWKATPGISYGSQYVELSRKLREAIRQNPGGPRTLSELDAVVWYLHYNSW